MNTRFNPFVLFILSIITILSSTSGNAQNLSAVVWSKMGLYATAVSDSTYITSVGDKGTVIRAQPFGIITEKINSGVNTLLRGICYCPPLNSSTNGYIVGDSGTILKSTNNGAAWHSLNSGTNLDLYGLIGLDSNRVWVVADSGYILNTSDGGNSWIYQQTGVKATLHSICYNTNNNVLLAVGDSGTVITSLDGVNWTKETVPTHANLLSVVRAGNNFIAVGDSGTILLSQDLRLGWTILESGTKKTLRCITAKDLDVSIWGDNIILTCFTNVKFVFTTLATFEGISFLGAANIIAYHQLFHFAVRIDGVLSYITSPNLVQNENGIKREFKLFANYPNPFNPTTNISFQIPSAAHVALDLFSINGEKITSLVNEQLQSGSYTQQINAEALHLASGTYLCRMLAVDELTGKTFTQTQKLVLMK